MTSIDNGSNTNLLLILARTLGTYCGYDWRPLQLLCHGQCATFACHLATWRKCVNCSCSCGSLESGLTGTLDYSSPAPNGFAHLRIFHTCPKATQVATVALIAAAAAGGVRLRVGVKCKAKTPSSVDKTLRGRQSRYQAPGEKCLPPPNSLVTRQLPLFHSISLAITTDA